MTRRKVFAGIFATMLLCGTMAFAQKKPVQNVSSKKHPNLAAAQRLSEQAYQKVVAAQKANEWDMEGHAQRQKICLIRPTTNSSKPPKPPTRTRSKSLSEQGPRSLDASRGPFQSSLRLR